MVRAPTDVYEIATKQYLETLGLGEVRFEPLGECTSPDFSVGDSIAVEVTRLVKTIISNGFQINITQRHPSTIESLRNVVEGFDAKDLRRSFFVDFGIREPINIHQARIALRKFLRDFLESGRSECDPIFVCDGLQVEVYEATGLKEAAFRLASISGPDFSGWVSSELLEGCENAVQRKSGLVERIKADFSEFWLAVGSYLTFGNVEEYVTLLQRKICVNDNFDVILLVNAKRPADSTMVRLR